MAAQHNHFCPRCKVVYSCTADRPVDASIHGGPGDSVCFHHYGIPHDECPPVEVEPESVIVVGGY